MRFQEDETSPQTARTVIDRHAVTAAGQLLMSAIWLEHRVRRFSPRLSVLPISRVSGAADPKPSSAETSDRLMLAPKGRATEPTPDEEKGATQ